ncbi:MAG: hypothetical protein H6510_02595 [Acidobacteria bacterium]|nr:hypothetical protein [Acidobacteriota bacterium]MCB9396684.1 hypothetical protein [Acidobacteriota bacterium]
MHRWVIFMVLFTSLMGQSTSQQDYVRIGYIPSRGAFMKGEATKILEANSLSFNHNASIKAFYDRMQTLAEAGVIDNATEFHQPTIYLEAMVDGQRIRLSWSGPTNQEKFRVYEREWRKLYADVHTYLIDFSPAKPPPL